MLIVVRVDLFELLRVESLSQVVNFVTNIERVLARDVIILHFKRLLVLAIVVFKHVVNIKVTDIISLKPLQWIPDNTDISH